MKYAVGIDVGGTNTRVALINEKYEIKERVQFGSDPKNPIKTLNQINDVIKGFGEKIEGIGISCPGPLDLINGIILTPPNLPGWHNFELTKELEKITGISVQLENDANLAGLAEPRENVRVGQAASVYIKALIPEKMKVKLIIVDVFENSVFPSKINYFITSGRLTKWVYSTNECYKNICSEFV